MPFVKTLLACSTALACTLTLAQNPSPTPAPAPAAASTANAAPSKGELKAMREFKMLDFCAAHGIVSEIEMVGAQDIESAYARMLKSDVKYRFVIDCASM